MGIEEVTTYSFSFDKHSSYQKKIIYNIKSKGIFSLLKNVIDKDNVDFTFTDLEYSQKDVKEPLLFSPISWRHNKQLNIVGIKEKDSFKPLWDRYKDGHRVASNNTLFLVFEKLYFNTLLGMEYDMLSNGVNLAFFFDYNREFEENKIYLGLDYLLLPLNIPVNTFFKCKSITDKNIILEGWITLNESVLDELLRTPSFIEEMKDYHSSLDFKIKSNISILIDKSTRAIKNIKFNLVINGGGDLFETIDYEVSSTQYKKEIDIYKTYKGKDYTYEQWQKYIRDSALEEKPQKKSLWKNLFGIVSSDTTVDDNVYDPTKSNNKLE